MPRIVRDELACVQIFPSINYRHKQSGRSINFACSDVARINPGCQIEAADWTRWSRVVCLAICEAEDGSDFGTIRWCFAIRGISDSVTFAHRLAIANLIGTSSSKSPANLSVHFYLSPEAIRLSNAPLQILSKQTDKYS